MAAQSTACTLAPCAHLPPHTRGSPHWNALAAEQGRLRTAERAELAAAAAADPLPKGIALADVYLVNGVIPEDSRLYGMRHAIRTPPFTGRGLMVAVREQGPDGPRKGLMLVSPCTLQSYHVPDECVETDGARAVPYPRARLVEKLLSRWSSARVMHEGGPDSGAYRLLHLLGAEPPAEAPSAERFEEERQRGGKPAGTPSPIRRGSRRGEVAAFFEGGAPRSVPEAMAKLGMTRSGVLSHLFCLNRDHGVGYELADDCARLVGEVLWSDAAASSGQQPSAASETPGGVAGEARAASGRGKPVRPDALRPIGTKRRADVARHFLAGWAPVDAAAAALGLSRSAVLSHLFTINAQNGLGYELSEDGRARLVVPDGHRAVAEGV